MGTLFVKRNMDTPVILIWSWDLVPNFATSFHGWPNARWVMCVSNCQASIAALLKRRAVRMGVLGGDAALEWCCSDVGHIGPQTQMMQSSLGCQLGIWTSLVEDSVITHSSRDSSAFQIVSSSPWGRSKSFWKREEWKSRTCTPRYFSWI